MKKMITLPPFDNNSYVWQGKGWKKINIYSNINLASPDLTVATYLGGGDYRIYDDRGITLDYNVYSGIFNINGSLVNGFDIWLFNIQKNTQYTASYVSVSGTLSGTLSRNYFRIVRDYPVTTIIIQSDENISKENIFTTTTENQVGFRFGPNQIFNNYQFKLQLEKGDTATPYQVPDRKSVV